MKKWWNKFCDKFYTKATECLTNGGGYALFALALIAIAFAIVGFYGQNGFDWRWFVFFHLPLYIFCAWALWQAMKMYRSTLKDIEENKKKEDGKEKDDNRC